MAAPYENIEAYNNYFLDRANSLPIIGQTDAGLEALGHACRKAMIKGKPLTDEELEDLAPKPPDGSVI